MKNGFQTLPLRVEAAGRIRQQAASHGRPFGACADPDAQQEPASEGLQARLNVGAGAARSARSSVAPEPLERGRCARPHDRLKHAAVEPLAPGRGLAAKN